MGLIIRASAYANANLMRHYPMRHYRCTGWELIWTKCGAFWKAEPGKRQIKAHTICLAGPSSNHFITSLFS